MDDNKTKETQKKILESCMKSVAEYLKMSININVDETISINLPTTLELVNYDVRLQKYTFKEYVKALALSPRWAKKFPLHHEIVQSIQSIRADEIQALELKKWGSFSPEQSKNENQELTAEEKEQLLASPLANLFKMHLERKNKYQSYPHKY